MDPQQTCKRWNPKANLERYAERNRRMIGKGTESKESQQDEHQITEDNSDTKELPAEGKYELI